MKSMDGKKQELKRLLALSLALKLTDKFGDVVSEVERPADSFVWAWLAGIFARMMFQPVVAKDTSGVDRTMHYNASSMGAFSFNSPGSGDTRGLVIGTHGAVNTMSGYALGDLIPNGSGAGEMNYGPQSVVSVPDISYFEDRVVAKFKFQRTFTNNSGAGISVRETGLYGLFADSTNNVRYFMFIRDNFSAAYVSNESTLTVTYGVSIEIPVHG